MIKALIFDLGEIVVGNNWYENCPSEFCTYFGVTKQQFWEGFKKVWHPMQLGEVSEEEFWKFFLTASGSQKIDVIHAKLLWRKYQWCNKQIFNLLMRLRNRYTLVACSNNGKEWVDYYKSAFHLDTYFDAIVNSAEVHFRKPDPEIYRIAIKKTGCKPNEIIYIDDLERFIEGAKKEGLHTIKYENVTQLDHDLNKMGVDVSILDISSRAHSFYWQTDRKISEIQIKHIFQTRHSFFDRESAITALETALHKRVKDIIPPIKSGSINSVVKATMNDGVDVIMRMHPNALKNGYFWAEKAIADTAREANVPTYETLAIDDTKKHVPFDFMITSCLTGNNMKHTGPFPPEVDKILIEDTGRLLALTHSIKTNGYGFYDNELAKKAKLIGIHDSWRDHIYSSLQDNLSYLQKMKAINQNERTTIEKVFKDHDSLFVCDSPRLIHNDLADWNELTDGKKITGFIDWDEAFSGDPICDFSAYSVFYDDVRLHNLIRGYETVSKLPPDFEAKFHLYRLRYIISKLTLRTKRSVFDDTQFLRDFLKYSKELLAKELMWYSNG